MVVLWIILFLAAAILFAIAAILFTPFFISMAGGFDGENFSLNFLFYWINPYVVKISYSLSDKNTLVSIFGKVCSRMGMTGADNRQPGKPADDGLAENVVGDIYKPLPKTDPCDEFVSTKESSEGASVKTFEWQRQKDECTASPKAEADYAGQSDIKSSGHKASEKSASNENVLTGLLRIKRNKALFLLRQERLFRRMVRCVIKTLSTVLRIINFKKFKCHIKAGSSDPSISGILFGCFEAVRRGLGMNSRSGVELNFEPVFNKGETFEYQVFICARSSFASLLAPAVVALCTFPYLSTFIAWRRMKKTGML
jgi:hypothetical protein